MNDDWNQTIIISEIEHIKSFINPMSIISKDTSSDSFSILNDDIIQSKEAIDNTILSIDFTKCDPLQLIEYQLKLVNYLLKLFKINRLNSISDYEPYFIWISKSSEHLALSIHQPINRTKYNNLMRSSYKFCNKKSDCQSHYGFLFQKKTKCCINDHYVHNKIVSDIDNLLEYLKRNIHLNQTKVVIETELKKGLETINYVINHMYQELSSFMLYLGKSKYNVKDFYRFGSYNHK